MTTAPLPQNVPAEAALSEPRAQGQPKNVEEAAEQFEALLIGQMLRSAREAASSDGEDNASATMLDVADQQFSQLLAHNGGLGLAQMIAKGLKPSGQRFT